MAEATQTATETGTGATGPTPLNGSTPPPDGADAPPAAESPAEGGSPAPSEDAVSEGGTPAERPDNLPEHLWDAEAGAPKLDELLTEFNELRAFKAETEANGAPDPGVPEAPDGYEAVLPEGLDLPEDFDLNLDPDDPAVGPIIEEVRAFAHEAGLNQDQFSNLLGLAAKRDIAEQKELAKQSAKEREALGPNVGQRVDAIANFLHARVGEDAAKSLLGVLFTKTQVEAFEGLMKQFSSRGVPAPGQGGRDSGSQRGVDGWGEMSTTRKFMHALTGGRK